MTEQDLYQLMHDLGDHRVRQKIEDLRNKQAFTASSVGSRLASEAGGVLYHALKKWLGSKKNNMPNIQRMRQTFGQIGLARATAVTMRFLVDRLAMANSSFTLGAIRVSLANALTEEMDFLLLSKTPGYRWRERELNTSAKASKERRKIKNRLMTQAPDVRSDWDRKDAYMMASILIDFCVKQVGMFKVEKRRIHPNNDYRKKAKIHHVVSFSEEIEKWIQDGINWIRATTPTHLPITETPLDWAPGRIGGYRSDKVAQTSLVTSRARIHRQLLDESDCPEIYSAINTMQRTGFKINPLTYAVFKVAVERNWEELDLASHPPIEPEKPTTEWYPGSPDWRAYARAKRAYTVYMDDFVRAKSRIARTLSIASIYADFPEFFFPHCIDFRGRSYPLGALNYQGPDYQRGMLTFSESKPVETKESLMAFLVHGANCFGVDKVPYAERVDWVLKNKWKIEDTIKDPYAYRWWTEADEPFQFLAWCDEAVKYFKDGLPFDSSIAVCADGSNNGLQVYSLLLRDEVGGFATNCVPADSPQDIYAEVAKRTTEKLQVLTESSDPTEARRAKQLLKFCATLGEEGVPRAAVKRPVMTLPYGATRYSCQHYLSEWYHDYVRGKNLSKEEAPFPLGDSYLIFTWLGGVVWDSIGEVVIKAREAMDWLRSLADVASEQNKDVTWVTPLGLKVAQHYRIGNRKKLTLKAGGRMYLSIWEEDDRVNGPVSRNGVCPNLIHSLDASAMFRTVNIAAGDGVTHFQMIHDGFGCHAADAPKLFAALRESYTSIFSEDLLGLLVEGWKDTIGPDIPEPPATGTLDISNLEASAYFFA